jgi:hypothetical protein
MVQTLAIILGPGTFTFFRSFLFFFFFFRLHPVMSGSSTIVGLSLLRRKGR